MDVVVVGSCNTDFSSYVTHLPKVGETLTGNRFETGFGGKGANQCIAAVKLGAKAAMIAKLGNDIFGQQYMNNLCSNNVNCDFVGIAEGVSTGIASIFVSDDGSNCIVIVPGANDLITVSDVEAAEELIKYSKIVVCQNEIPQKISLAALKLAHRFGVRTIFNPAPAQDNFLPDLFSIPDIFCVNESEAERLIGQPVSSVDTAKSACKVLIESKGCKSVIVTLGENGAVYQGKQDMEPVHIPVPAVKAIDTTGAGDSFIGSLSFFLATRPDLSVPEMINRAGQVAAISVMKPGTQKSYPSATELPPHLLV